MGSPEWSPNEGYLKKLERLAFALVRTKPVTEDIPSTPRPKRGAKSPWLDKGQELAGPLTLTLLIVVPIISENSEGPIILASLLIAAAEAAFTVWAYTEFESQHGPCWAEPFPCLFSHIGEFPAFLWAWWRASALVGVLGAAARTVSGILDAVTGKHVETLMENTVGSFTPFGAPLDVISAGVMSVPAIMLGFGVEDGISNILPTLTLCLCSLTSVGVVFSLLLSGYQVLPVPESETEAVSPYTAILLQKVLSSAALLALGFLSLFTTCRPRNLTLLQHQHLELQGRKRVSRRGMLLLMAPLFPTILQGLLTSWAYQFQTAPGPLWAGDPPLLAPTTGVLRIGVALFGVGGLCLTLPQVLKELSLNVGKLGTEGLLYRAFRPKETGGKKWSLITPLVFGAVAALHAVMLDTKVLLGLGVASTMSIHIVICCAMIAARYQVPQVRARRRRERQRRGADAGSGGEATDSNSSRRARSVSFLSKSGGSKMPRDLNQEEGAGQGLRRGSVATFSSTVSGYESDMNCSEEHDQEGEEVEACSSSQHPPPEDGADDTDIDAVVTEYQEQVRVAMINGVVPLHPSPATARRVAFSVIALVPCCLAMAASVTLREEQEVTGNMLLISSSLLTFLLLVVISRQPQRRMTSRTQGQGQGQQGSSSEGPEGKVKEVLDLVHQSFEGSAVPWIPAVGLLVQSLLLLQGLDLAGTSFALWLGTGLIIYFSYSVVKSVAAPKFEFESGTVERVSLMQEQESSSDQGWSGQVDTVLLA